MRPTFNEKDWDVATDTSINSALLQRASTPAPGLELVEDEWDEVSESDFISWEAPNRGSTPSRVAVYASLLLACVACWWGIVHVIFGR